MYPKDAPNQLYPAPKLNFNSSSIRPDIKSKNKLVILLLYYILQFIFDVKFNRNLKLKIVKIK